MDFTTIIEKAKKCRMAVIGDFCLDIYWHADMRMSELSRETPHFPLPIIHEKMSAGGAGNVVANMLALEPACVQCIGVFGDDWRGHEYSKVLNAMGADTTRVAVDSTRITNTYIKPLRKGFTNVIYEDPRLDFTNYEPLSADTEQRLLNALDDLNCDVLCVCDQMRYGCITPAVRERICQLGRDGLCIVVDSRDRIGLYKDVIVKPNELEAGKALAMNDSLTMDKLQLMAARLSRQTCRPAIVTAGEHGCMTADGSETTHIPAVPLTGEIDICGAGDTFMAAFSCAYAVGASLNEAATLACRASAIIVKKINTTGTASWNELASLM